VRLARYDDMGPRTRVGIDPINLSAKPFCQGEPGASGLCHGCPWLLVGASQQRRRLISIPDQVARSLIPGNASVIWSATHSAVG